MTKVIKPGKEAQGEPVSGVHAINHRQAVIIRRIFKEFAVSVSPLAIAQRLEDQGVPRPDGGWWTDFISPRTAP